MLRRAWRSVAPCVPKMNCGLSLSFSDRAWDREAGVLCQMRNCRELPAGRVTLFRTKLRYAQSAAGITCSGGIHFTEGQDAFL